jgi:hypothetical protein
MCADVRLSVRVLIVSAPLPRVRSARLLTSGYDVGEAVTSGTASSSTYWMSPLGKLAGSEPRVWSDPRVVRPPGKFLLNMLVMNEAAHLTRTLPQWAKVIDYWIIGVDEKNTDNSYEIIKKYLGHLPGEIALVSTGGSRTLHGRKQQHDADAMPRIRSSIVGGIR